MSISLGCAGGRGVGDMAAQGLFPGSAPVCAFACLFVRSRGGEGAECGPVSEQGPDQTMQESEISIFEREIGSDSLILGVREVLLC